MAKNKLLPLQITLVAILSVLFSTVSNRNAYAAREYSESSCKSEANGFDSTGVAASACDRATAGNCKSKGNHYGTIYIRGNDTDIEADGTNSIVTYAYGRVFNCTSEWAGADVGAHSISFGNSNIQQSGTTLNRSLKVETGKNGSYAPKFTWGPESSDSIKLTVAASVLRNTTSHDSNGLYWLDLKVKSTLNGGTEAERDTTLNFYKIARISHDTPSVSYGGRTYSNGDTIEVNGTSASLTFNHYLKRTDGWGGSINITELYSLNGSSRRGVNGLGTSPKTISDAKNNLAATPSGTEYCSTLNHYTVRGLDGYSAKRGSSESKICTPSSG